MTTYRTPDAVFTVSDGRLVVTFHPESLNVCKHCPDLHALVLAARGETVN